MAFIRWLHTCLCAIWAEFTRNPKVYALLIGQPIMLSIIVWLVVRSERWGHALYQLETARLLIVGLCATHAIVAIAMAAVKVTARAPGGAALTVGGDGGTLSATATAEVAIQGGGDETGVDALRGKPDRDAGSPGA